YMHYFAIEQKFNIKEKMIRYGRNIAIQGETVGPKIGLNKLGLKEYDFRVFNIYDIEQKCYLPWDDVLTVTNHLGLNTVPVIFHGICDESMLTREYLMSMAEGLEYLPGIPAEGIVVKTDSGKDHARYSFKVISNKFLQKFK